ncbi:hypothetical protein SK128_022444 [Halocaridina rubra]|uniref:Uncharacterized protein n=1 Tax=Halocaridina rubra TaxID=373956 RepID=A0AAN8WXL8_HALRR
MPAPEEYVRHYDHRKVEDGLLISNLGLNFKLSKSDFINGELKLKCTATIAALYTKSDEHSQQDQTAEVRDRFPTEGSLTTAGTGGCGSLVASVSLHHFKFLAWVVLHLSFMW